MRAHVSIGLLLPNATAHVTLDRMVPIAVKAEQWGFDGVWVRDNLGFEGHSWEPDTKGYHLIDPFIALSAVAGATKRLRLGTAVVIPFRHPLITAQLFGSLSWISGGRVEIGLGSGGWNSPSFDLLFPGPTKKALLFRDTIETLRLSAKGERFSYRGANVEFNDALITPSIRPDSRIWYGGGSPTAVKRAMKFANGILPARCPRWRLQEIRAALDAQSDRTVLIGTIPLVVVGRTRQEAFDAVALPPVFDMLTEYWGRPVRSLEDAEDAIVVGTPEECAAALSRIADVADVVVLDARLQFANLEATAETLGTRLLPALRAQQVAV